MLFKKFGAGCTAYGTDQDPEPGDIQEQNVCFHDPHFDNVLAGNDQVEKDALIRVLIFLACCHTIVIDAKKGKRTYNAASPDELALVNFAK
jgi:magnesium-transporting ATPase (P-type)